MFRLFRFYITGNILNFTCQTYGKQIRQIPDFSE